MQEKGQFFISRPSGRVIALYLDFSYVDLRYLSKQTNARFMLFSLSLLAFYTFGTRDYTLFPRMNVLKIFPRKEVFFLLASRLRKKKEI